MSEQQRNVRLLMVDDEEDFLIAASDALARRGIEVIAVQKAQDALISAKHGDFDVAVIDMKMPEMDGEELFRRLSEQEPQLPVIILTGHGSILQAFRIAREGIYDYLAKPCDMDVLAAKIHEANEIRRAHSTPSRPGLEPIVLLIDDEVELLDSMRPVLERRGFSLMTASNAVGGLQILGRKEVDVVVLDLKMPGMDGMTALKELKTRFPTVEVILLTGHPTLDTAQEGIKVGAFEYLAKPVDMEELVEMINSANQKRQDGLELARKKQIRDLLDRYGD
ncbi:MAG: response regulator [bacterium]